MLSLRSRENLLLLTGKIHQLMLLYKVHKILKVKWRFIFGLKYELIDDLNVGCNDLTFSCFSFKWPIFYKTLRSYIPNEISESFARDPVLEQTMSLNRISITSYLWYFSYFIYQSFLKEEKDQYDMISERSQIRIPKTQLLKRETWSSELLWERSQLFGFEKSWMDNQEVKQSNSYSNFITNSNDCSKSCSNFINKDFDC
jgi:hypothetical protein